MSSVCIQLVNWRDRMICWYVICLSPSGNWPMMSSVSTMLSMSWRTTSGKPMTCSRSNWSTCVNTSPCCMYGIDTILAQLEGLPVFKVKVRYPGHGRFERKIRVSERGVALMPSCSHSSAGKRDIVYRLHIRKNRIAHPRMVVTGRSSSTVSSELRRNL